MTTANELCRVFDAQPAVRVSAARAFNPRRSAELPSVLGDIRKADDRWDWMLDKQRKIGYIRITSDLPILTFELFGDTGGESLVGVPPQ